MREVGDEHPRGAEADACEEGHGEHEPPALAERPSQGVGAQEPDACPKGQHEAIVLQASRHPFSPEVLTSKPLNTGPGIAGWNWSNKRTDHNGMLHLSPIRLQLATLTCAGASPRNASTRLHRPPSITTIYVIYIHIIFYIFLLHIYIYIARILVALATRALIGEVHPPLQGEERARVVEAEEVDHRDPRHGEDVLVPGGSRYIIRSS